jgi:hypothetical protein
MRNLKEESSTKNKRNVLERVNYAPGHQAPVPAPTLQRKVASKIEITITPDQLIAAKWLFRQYDLKAPGWLRQKFYINQRRRKCLNVELTDAQLDRAFCGHRQNPLEWDGLLHLLWHDINGVPTCK